MKCRKCGYEIDTTARQLDGSLVCPSCGVMYRRKENINSTAPSAGDTTPAAQPTLPVPPSSRAPRSRRYRDVPQAVSEHIPAAPLPESDEPIHADQRISSIDAAPKKERKKESKPPRYKRKRNSSRKIFKWVIMLLILAVIGLVVFLLLTGRLDSLFTHKTSSINPNENVIQIVPDQSLPIRSTEKNTYVIVTGDSVNIREGAGIDFAVIDTAQRGERLDYAGVSSADSIGNSWYQVKVGSVTGWIASQFSVPYTESGDVEGTSENRANLALFDFRLTDEDMANLETGINSHLCFTVQCSRSLPSAIHIIRKDTGELIGEMKDDGQNEDSVAGDGIYTLGFNVNAVDRGKVVYCCVSDAESSNEVQIHFFRRPTAADNQFDHTEQLVSAVEHLEQPYLDADGYADLSMRDALLHAVYTYVEDQYYAGNVSEYHVSEYSVYYKDAFTGISVIYSPPIQGVDSSGAQSPTVMLSVPYANASEKQIPLENFGFITNMLSESLCCSTTTYADDAVTPEVFTYIKPHQIFLWNGHGGMDILPSQPILVTGMRNDAAYFAANFGDFISGRLGMSEGRIYVTPQYIRKYGGDMTGSLIWIGSCHSAHNSALANSFLAHGASAFVGFSEEVISKYDLLISRGAFAYMVDGIIEENRYYSIDEAVRMAMETFGLDDSEYATGKYANKTPAHPVIYGEKSFSLESLGIPLTTAAQTPVPTQAPAPTVRANQPDNGPFTLVGTWKSVGSYGFGQAQPGAIVGFDGTHCNFYSPYDTYSFYERDGQYFLDITSFIFGENLTFDVQILNNDHINIIYNKSYITELTRSEVGEQVNTIINDISDLLNMLGN